MSNESDVYNMDIGLHAHIIHIIIYTVYNMLYTFFTLTPNNLNGILFVISNNNVLFGSIFIHTHNINKLLVYLCTTLNRTVTHLVFFFENIK